MRNIGQLLNRLRDVGESLHPPPRPIMGWIAKSLAGLVPYLSEIPLIGLAFKTRNASATKNNLMIFIRPTILRDQSEADARTQQKYNYMLDRSRATDQRELLPLLPGDTRPSLPPMPDIPPRP